MMERDWLEFPEGLRQPQRKWYFCWYGSKNARVSRDGVTIGVFFWRVELAKAQFRGNSFCLDPIWGRFTGSKMQKNIFNSPVFPEFGVSTTLEKLDQQKWPGSWTQKNLRFREKSRSFHLRRHWILRSGISLMVSFPSPP